MVIYLGPADQRISDNAVLYYTVTIHCRNVASYINTGEHKWGRIKVGPCGVISHPLTYMEMGCAD